jgi:PEP-CTERM/exosortase A-associated glycosyltransferase
MACLRTHTAMKILHILDHSIPLHSGYAFRTLSILRQQRALGWDTAQVTSTKHGACEADVEDVGGLRFYRTRVLDGVAARLPMLNQWEVVKALEGRLPDVIEAERPDVLHAHSPSLNGWAALRVSRRFGLPLVYECRAFWEDAAADHGTGTAWGPRYWLTRAMETLVFRGADAVTCICEGLRRDIVQRGIPGDKVTVIPNAVDLERFELDMPRDHAIGEELGLSGATVLGFLGSFYAYEGLGLVIRALPKVLREFPDVRLLLVGGGPQDTNLRELTRSLRLQDRVVFVGRVAHDRIDRYYSIVDLLVYPRLPMRLTDLVTPLKPLEAMAQGKLVLASDVGGHRELIGDGRNGRLFKAGDVDALADAVIGCLRDRGSWEGQRAAGRRYVEEERNWAKSVANYERVYERVLGTKG